ncbi:MAG: hypothetical protein E6F99_13780 [Actinobacteria bacterium]|nr:MAG: hypothetical protein E6F99_13780 [Actinomycetota bacterium]
MATIALPASLAIRNLLEDLLGREVTVGPADPPVVADTKRTVAAIYVDNSTTMVAVLGLDLELAAYAAAALGLMPAGGVQDCIQDGVLSPTLAENVGELFNVLTSLLNREGGPHIKLYKMYQPPDPLPNDAQALLLAIGNRTDLTVEVARYGKGRLSLSLPV